MDNRKLTEYRNYRIESVEDLTRDDGQRFEAVIFDSNGMAEGSWGAIVGHKSHYEATGAAMRQIDKHAS